ncbi:uncharacterized protein LOC131950385 [Physella acuta]|uniref:uncharacterized protein LOC131950385 n=1 Tax=Physella acuta TaxID=109671 RepID=UPI0027DB1DCD|nr:uncharacterized protein LOC131950385 [Physella acuta]
MGPIAFFWVSTLLCLFGFIMFVHGGSCGQSGDCILTDNTVATCTSNVCACRTAEYSSIRTGCGEKLKTPTAQLETGRSSDLFSATTGILQCSTVPGASSYKWFNAAAYVNTSKTLTISEAGEYKCQAIANTESLNSDKSDAVSISILTSGAYAGSLAASIASTAGPILTGNNVTLSCSGVPMGYSGQVSFREGTNLVASSTTSLSVKLPMTAALSTKSISCNLDSYKSITFSQSALVTLPTASAAVTVAAVTLVASDSVTGDLAGETTYNVGADGPTLTCTTTPIPEYLDISKIQYEFLVGATSLIKSSSNTYKVDTSKEITATYKCIVTYNNVPTEKVLAFTINVKNSFISDPTVIKAPNGDITLASTLVLSCGESSYTADSYQWSFKDNPIEGQKDKTIQLYQFAATDIGVYKCRAVKSRYTTAYASFHAIMKPTLTGVASGKIYGAGGDYVLKCNTVQSISGWTYSWKKGDNDLKITTDAYSIINATAAIHNGSYTCTSTYNGASSTSEPLTVAVEAAGKRCSIPGDCDTTKGYAGTCPTATPQVCTCANYFVPRGDVCALIKPTISRDPAGTAFYAGTNYVLTCNSGSDNTTGWTYAWKKDNGDVQITTAKYTITGANATTHNGSYTCTTTFSTFSSTSDALIVSVVASATAPFINCALMVIMAALGSLFI